MVISKKMEAHAYLDRLDPPISLGNLALAVLTCRCTLGTQSISYLLRTLTSNAVPNPEFDTEVVTLKRSMQPTRHLIRYKTDTKSQHWAK